MDRDFQAEFKVSLELEGERRISASHLFELLENIVSHGSISRASSNMNLSYRYSWGLIREAEKSLGVALVDKQVGGYAGGGTTLTPEGKELLLQYKAFKAEIGSGLNRFLSTASSSKKLAAPENENVAEYAGRPLLLASTMEPVETGLLDLLEQAFYRISGILVRHISLGSGRALQIAREGRVDMALTHAPKLENEFMRQGWGIESFPLMANDFVLAGPISDPAGLKNLQGEEGVLDALQRITKFSAPFVSRGDSSGTHLKEKELWEEAGIMPGGDWYLKSPGAAGNLGTLRLAAEKGAYTLVDRASFLISRAEEKMAIFVAKENQGDASEKLQNIFVLTIVSPQRVPVLQYRESVLFAKWLLGKEARKIISTFGQDNFSRPLFSTFHFTGPST